jgi:hypothetical protein
MWRFGRSARFLAWAVVLTVLTVRASDTHLHLCFDGQEPPTTVHFADASVHHDDHHEGEDHADKDVDPFVGTLAKSGDADTGVALLASIPALAIFLPVMRGAPPMLPDLEVRAAGPPFHLRPPLRGPPA